VQGIFHFLRADAGVFADLTTCRAQAFLLRVESFIDTSRCRGYFWYEELAGAPLSFEDPDKRSLDWTLSEQHRDG
jgi:hypothetical protein